MKKQLALLVAISALASMGAEFRTPNFVVISASSEVCQQVGKWAEHYRKEKAVSWLGHEMPNWPEPCPLRVNVTMGGPSGATEFTFGMGRVTSQRMQIQGPLDRLIYSVLPHEITHTIFAHHFKTPVPRWADEGGSVLSEDDMERDRHDKEVRNILNRGQQIPMRSLMAMREYPPQVICLYAQGYSMSDFLVKRSNKQHFLNFVGAGMQQGWDQAAKSHYGHNNVEELEQAWLKHLQNSRKQPVGEAVARQEPGSRNQESGRMVWLTSPPAQPLDPQPLVRGAMGGQDRWQSGGVELQRPTPIYTPTSSAGVQLGAPVQITR